MTKPNIAIVDYDCGNLFSLARALTELGVSSTITRDLGVIRHADKMILPGVGAFGEGMERIRNYELLDAILDFAGSGKPVLGICLGMQLLLDESFEFGQHQGLKLIQGKVTRLDQNKADARPIKIPHIGWNSILFDPQDDKLKGLFRGLTCGTYMYFLHSFFVAPAQENHNIATTDYGPNRFCSIVKKDNILGVQFHPEISGPSGLRLLQNFVFET